jgi:hypothetical protein
MHFPRFNSISFFFAISCSLFVIFALIKQEFCSISILFH